MTHDHWSEQECTTACPDTCARCDQPLDAAERADRATELLRDVASWDYVQWSELDAFLAGELAEADARIDGLHALGRELADENAQLREALLLVRRSGGTDLLSWQEIDALLASAGPPQEAAVSTALREMAAIDQELGLVNVSPPAPPPERRCTWGTGIMGFMTYEPTDFCIDEDCPVHGPVHGR